MSKIDRATAVLEPGRQYILDGEPCVFQTFELRPLPNPSDWPDLLAAFVGALWPAEASEEPIALVLRRGRIEALWEGGLVDTRHSTLDLIHETRHADGGYVRNWFWCDGVACEMANL